MVVKKTVAKPKSKSSPTQKALNVWAVILIIWAIYRANLKLPEWFDEFIAKPVVFILPVYWYITTQEKQNFLKGIWLQTKNLKSDLLYGLSVGLVFIMSAVAANLVKTHEIPFMHQTVDIKSIAWVVILALATGISEEILSRGFVLKRLYEETKNPYTSSFFASILFFFLHVPILFTNNKITGSLLLLFMGTDLIISLVNSFIFLERKSLLLPILIHAFYNITIILFL